jgi:M6 family metalloprotease-like protein
MTEAKPRRYRLTLIVLLTGMIAAGVLFLARGRKIEPAKRSEPEHAHPLVILLLKCPGPTASRDKQFRKGEVAVEKPIPDGLAPGLESDLILGDGAEADLDRIFGLEMNLTITHPRVADLTIALSAVSRDGKEILKSQVLWDGPAEARGKSVAEADHLAFRPNLRPGALLNVTRRRCRRWRLAVADASPGKVGYLKNWGLTCRMARFPFAHNQVYYRRLLFGDGHTRDPLRFPNAADYFREVSRDKVTYTNAGIFGPVLWEGWDDSSDRDQCDAAARLLEAQGFDFRPFDTDHNGIVTVYELTVLVIHNDGDGHDGRTRNYPYGTLLEQVPLRVAPAVVFVPQQADFQSLTHELSHALDPLRMVDLYGGKECFSQGLTLMSCTLNAPPDDKKSIYLDPWHRRRFGWIGSFDPGTADGAVIGSEPWVDSSGTRSHPMIVRKPGGDGSEYYLFEFRDGSGYDNGVGDCGIVAWHVREDGKGAPFVGEAGDSNPGQAIHAVGPDAERGGGHAWKPGDGKFRLRWADGSLLQSTYWVEASSTGKRCAVLRWSTKAESRPHEP